MVEKWIWKLPYMSLSPNLPTLHIWLIFSYFSTFQPGVKLVEKNWSGGIQMWLKAQNGSNLTSGPFNFRIFYFYFFTLG